MTERQEANEKKEKWSTVGVPKEVGALSKALAVELIAERKEFGISKGEAIVVALREALQRRNAKTP